MLEQKRAEQKRAELLILACQANQCGYTFIYIYVLYSHWPSMTCEKDVFRGHGENDIGLRITRFPTMGVEDRMVLED